MAFFLFPMKEGERSLDIFKIVGRIALDGQEQFNRDVGEAKGQGASLAKAIGKGLATAAKVGAAAMTAASTAVVAVGKASLDAYSEYEQLAGGMEKIFSAMDTSQISKDAAEAYKFLVMSANEYLAVINDVGASFSATMGAEAGYEVAKKGLTAISDYASGTGKSFDELQGKFAMITRSTASYQSIADQFSGILPATSDGFLKQAKAAGILSNKYSKLTQVPIEEYQRAVAEMLEKGVADLNLTGNTAAEAAETVSGSLAMTKAAWKNLLVGFADGNQDLDLLIDNFVTSLTTAARKIVPKLTQILGGLSDAIAEIIPVIAEELPELLEELLPGIIKGAGALIQGLIEALPELLPVLWSALGQIFSGIWDYIFVDLLGTDYDFSAMFSDLTKAAKGAWSEIQQTWNAIGRPVWDSMVRCVEMVRNAFQKKMPEMKGFASDAFGDIVSFWNDNLQPCLQAIGDFIENYIAPVFEAVFGQIISASVEAGFQYISDLWNNTLMPVLTGITDFLTGVFTGNWEQAFLGLEGILNGFNEYFNTTWNATVTYFTTLFAPVVPWFQDAWNSIKEWAANAVESMKEKWEDFKESIAEKIASVVATVTSKFTEIKQQIESKVNDAKQKAKEAFEEIKKGIQEAMEQAKQKVSEKWEEIKGFFADAVEVGKKIVDDIRTGISQAWDGLTKWFEDLWDNLFGNLKANISVNKTDNTNGNSHATGLNFVPYDEYPATLHQGEAVLNSVQARAWRSGEGASGLNQDVTNVLLMILDAIVEGNSKETVFKLNNREFGRAVRGVVNV